MDQNEDTQLRAATTLRDASDSLVGQTLTGKYHLEAKLGAGGMGSVYRATRLLIGDEVAIKILHSGDADPRAAERFQREAQAAARLKHPNVVAIHDFGTTEEGLQYLVMELVEGESLRHLIKRQGVIAPAAAVEIIHQVCEALDDAHQHNVVHRDIKPDNIIVNITSNGVRAKVLDFGIAKLRDLTARDLTQTGSVMGTPHYMSPEQCLGEELDHRSDIYSLGIVLYEMLTGIVPFNSPISTAVVVQHVNRKPPSLRAINIGISEEVEGVVLHALEKGRDMRPQTASLLSAEFANALRQPSRSGPQVSMPDLGATQVMSTPGSLAASSGNIPQTYGSPATSKTAWTTWLAILVVVLVVVGTAIALIAGQNKDAGVSQSQASGNVGSSAITTPVPNQSQGANGISVEEVRQFLENWRSAWERKDLHTYASFYDESFTGRNYSSGSGYTSMTRAQWLKDKEQKFRRSSFLSITLGEPDIQIRDGGVSVSFSQEFRSSGYADRGAKSLYLRKTSNGFRILNEDFVPQRAAR